MQSTPTINKNVEDLLDVDVEYLERLEEAAGVGIFEVFNRATGGGDYTGPQLKYMKLAIWAINLKDNPQLEPGDVSFTLRDLEPTEEAPKE